MKKIAILQSNYIPWKGYFDIIAAVDEFIIFDDMQFTKNDWRNRNIIKASQGIHWLTIPVGKNINRRIRDVHIASSTWQLKHWKSLESSYKKAAYFNEIAEWLSPLYLKNKFSYLSQLNRCFIECICDFLNINTYISNSWDYTLSNGKTERLVDLCHQSGATEYISGPAAKGYINDSVFHNQGIKLTWFDYSNYPSYPQLWGDFIHEVTILDLLFNCGRDAHLYMRYSP
ncbi:WbqC family protein [Endozoicomonas sp. SM1973]|uniref:WbqC family protein n=1 Tax=Spartinivicinus marinus TaxID=2994442 RepID=A0A853IDN7_9GAMM|nr:WbqC family protein [Spartinivicinus marinus]